MISKPIALGLLAAACVTAAGGGAFLAVRQEPAVQPAQAQAQPASAPNAEPGVAESETIIAPESAVKPTAAPAPESREAAKVAVKVEPVERATAPKPSPRPDSASQPARSARTAAPPAAAPRSGAALPTVAQKSGAAASNTAALPGSSSEPAPTAERSPTVREATPTAATVPVLPEPVIPDPPVAPKPRVVEVVVPASSVVGLHVATSVTSETARVEDRVEARVTRDVMADGRVAIPEGTRVIGDVTLVERGGKMKDKAKLGVKFHTLILGDGSHVPFRTDAIYREGSSPGNESARKIGGAAIGGAILGAIIGGAKGAAIGGATGAAGGGAVVMAGDRNAATLPAGTVVTVRLSSPVTVDVQRELQQ
jgi:hypothetical protein